MSFGNWLYNKRKFKLFIAPDLNFRQKKKRLLALTYERNWEAPFEWDVKYSNINSAFKIISKPDFIIEREFNDGKALYDTLYKRELKTIPKAFWFIDAHISDIGRIQYCDNFDFVFVAHSPYLNFVKKNTVCKNIFWLPLCYPAKPTAISINNAALKYPVSFIGKFGKGFEGRNEMINFLKKEYQNDFFVATDYQTPKTLIQQSKITTNHSIKNDLNFRVFEAMGYGTALVTNYVTDLDKIEGLDNRLFSYKNFQELKKHIDTLLNDTNDKLDLHQVQQWIGQKHTMKNRLAEMLQMIETGKQVEYK